MFKTKEKGKTIEFNTYQTDYLQGFLSNSGLKA